MSKKPRLPLLIGSLVILAALVISALPGKVARAQTATLTFKPSADTYVNANYPSTNYGTATTLHIDSSPTTRSYLRFTVSGLNGAAIQSAKLRLYANSSNTTGYTAAALSNNTWTESGITYSNAPVAGAAIKTSGAITAGQWVEADVTSYVKAAGTYNLVVTTTSSTNTSLAARESGANAPQLVIVTSSTTTQPTATPAAVKPTATPASGLTKVNLTKGPDVIFTGNNTTMKLFWQTTSNTSFRVDWGATSTYGKSGAAVSAYDATNHLYSYTITGLTPGAKYYYRVVTGTSYSSGSFFAAPSAAATTLKFVSYGDDRSNPSTHNAVAAAVVNLFKADPGYQTLMLGVGDYVASGDTDSYWTSELFSTAYPSIRAELANMSELSVMGNHEGSGTLFKRYFPMPFVSGRYWSFDYGPAHFVMMDQYTSYSSGSAQYNWIKSDLANSTKKWKIVVLHEPGWTAGGGHNNNTTIQSVYQPLFVQYKVAVVLGGHNHYYARASVSGIQHLTIGTGGAPLYAPASGQPNIVKTYKGNGYTKFSISGSTLTGSFVTTSGTVIDTFTVTR